MYSYNFVELLNIEGISEQLEGDFGILGGIIEEFTLLFGDHTTYIWSQWHGNNLVQIGAILSIILGMGVIAKETSKGTISFLVSKPVSRFEIFTTKVATGVRYFMEL
ncbi:ABC transporter permease subunit [Natranaerofaba carboxydovora]|uniref:ABC transporter permease subunit n=1 Tax=Natranaerofaba carboxydovora TaxID=2742683 RepID=UPI001F148FA7|nr:ABC transporter permease subunit [Natranaerofaba carboxydovora]